MKNTSIKICGETFDKNSSHFRFRTIGRIPKMKVLKQLKEFENLTSVSFNDTNLDDKGLAYIVECEHIDNLNLQLTKVSDKGLALLANLKDLKYLRLKENHQLTNNCMQHINKLKNLIDLQIHDTNIDKFGLEELDLKHLESLIVDIWENNHSYESLLSLSKRLPKCCIVAKGRGEFNNGVFDGEWDV